MKQFTFGWLCVLLLGLSAPAWAQQSPPPAAAAKFTGKLSSDPAQFIQDAQLMMAPTNNAAAKTAAARLQAIWASNKLTDSQKRRLITVSQRMLELKFKPRPHFENLFTAVAAASVVQNFSEPQLDEMLLVINKALEKEPVQETATFLSSAAQFLDTKFLYRSRYNSLRVISGTFSFAYNEQDMPSMKPAPAPTPEPAPAVKPATKATKAAAKKRSSDGWDTADDLWGDDSGKGKGTDKNADSGWGDSGWGGAAKTGSYYVAPPTRGPVLVMKDADLFFSTSSDSVTLKKTSGVVVASSNRFVGYGGQFGWQVNGSPATADFETYDLDITKPEFTAEPVTLTYAAVLEAPVKGAFSYKSLKKKPGATDSGYPRFISLTNDARVKNIGSNIRYYGGFSLAGSRTLSASLDGSLSRIFVEADGKTKFRAASRAYVLGDSLITADRAAVTIFEDKSDSLTHPGVKLKYNKKANLLQLTRESGLYKSTPYFDSYHQMEITAEMLSWPLNTPHVNFSILTAKNQVTANFESKEFFTNTRYQQIKSINKLHPLQMIVSYSVENKNVRRFTVQDVATFRKLRPENVASAAAGLARDGYVDWNPQTQQITLRPKALHYVSANRGKKDYDHIAIRSLSPSGKNATLDLASNDLIVHGVERFNFSDDSVTVFVKPDSSTIRIQKNRGILFNGTVVSSAFTFKGKEFKFDYDGFYIDLVKIDSIIVKSKGAKGSNKKGSEYALTSKKKVATGRLYINAPNNKSGRKKLGAYPSFDSQTGAYVYFDKPQVLGGAYDTTIYFDIPPFKLDSLNTKNRTAGFNGTFVSGGIIPDLKTKLSLQEDGSLGFTYDLPKEGVPVYGGKGRLFNKVKMSNDGIQGVGTIKYLTSTLQSDQFIFYKDSVVTVGKAGVILPGPLNGTQFTKVTLPAGYQMKWAVKQDSMYLSTQPQGTAMKLYGDQYGFRGTATLTPGGLYGDGALEGPQSFIRSPDIAFKPTSYSGKRSTLSIKSAEANKPALTANNVAFSYDVQKGTADFARMEGDSKSSIDLPYSEYRTTLSGGNWDFKKKRVQLKVAPGADSTRSYFYSTKAEQNGLKFRAATGEYDLSRYRLVAGGVPHIAAADAWIEPDSNKVYILANAQMRTFQNANIVMDTLAKYHKLYKGEIKITSRTAFTGNALYSYKNAAADSFALKFTNFMVDSAAVGLIPPRDGSKAKVRKKPADDDGTVPAPPTVAVATIDSKENFRLAPRISYRGGVNMNSKQRGFIFDGQAKLDFLKLPNSSDWFAVQDSIDPKGIRMELPKPEKKPGEGDVPVLTGLFVADGTGQVYPRFVAPKLDVIDRNLFTAGGYLTFDDRKRTYTIANHDLTDPNIYEGAVLTFVDSSAAMTFRGPLNLINSNKDYAITGAGLGTAKPDSNQYSLDTFLAFDINMNAKAVEAMGADIASATKGSPEALNGTQAELYKLGEMMGSKLTQTYADRAGKYEPLQKLSPKLLHTIVLNKVDLRWSDKYKAWYSVGQIGLVSIGKRDLNVLIDGYVEIKKGDNNTDAVELYLEAEPQTWYYLKYSGIALMAKAQHGTFDDIIAKSTKGDYNTATQYGAYLGDEQELQQFLTRFRRDYLGDTKARRIVTTPPRESTGNFDFDSGKKKGKKGKNDDAFGDADAGQQGGGADAPTEDTGSKKKKGKKETAADPNDPFGGGDAGAAPAGKKEKKAEPAPAAPATPPAAAPTPEPAVDPKQAKKDEEKRLKEEEKKKKEDEKKAKEDEKKKKAAEDDPFGGT